MLKPKPICPECSEDKSQKELNKFGGICNSCANKIEYHKPTHSLVPESEKIKGRCVGVVDETAREVYKF